VFNKIKPPKRRLFLFPNIKNQKTSEKIKKDEKRLNSVLFRSLANRCDPVALITSIILYQEFWQFSQNI